MTKVCYSLQTCRDGDGHGSSPDVEYVDVEQGDPRSSPEDNSISGEWLVQCKGEDHDNCTFSVNGIFAQIASKRYSVGLCTGDLFWIFVKLSDIE